MYPYLGDFPTGKTIFFPFHTFNSAGGSVTITGFATSDIKVYKGVSMTERASTAGFTLVDTDGVDLDAITGIHGFSIDTSDNTDAGFFVAGADYTVVINFITVDGQSVAFIAGRFSIENRTVGNIGSNALTSTAIASGAFTSGKFANDCITAAALAAGAVTEISDGVKAAVVETAGAITLQQALSVILAAVAGVTSNSGATLKSPDGTATRITATLATNNRTAMVLTPSA